MLAAVSIAATLWGIPNVEKWKAHRAERDAARAYAVRLDSLDAAVFYRWRRLRDAWRTGASDRELRERVRDYRRQYDDLGPNQAMAEVALCQLFGSGVAHEYRTAVATPLTALHAWAVRVESHTLLRGDTMGLAAVRSDEVSVAQGLAQFRELTLRPLEETRACTTSDVPERYDPDGAAMRAPSSAPANLPPPARPLP